MSEGEIAGQLVGVVNEVVRALNMPTSNQLSYGTVVVLGVALTAITGVAIAAAVGGIVAFNEGRWPPAFYRRKKHHALTQEYWSKVFEPEEGRPIGVRKAIKVARFGGVEASIRAEVWPFLLGIYDFTSSAAERKSAEVIRRIEFENMSRQCVALRTTVYGHLIGGSAGEGGFGSYKEETESNGSDSSMEDVARVSGIIDISEPGSSESSSELQRGMVNSDDRVRKTFIRKVLAGGPKATEDFKNWLRIIRVDAVRMNAEWVPHSPIQENVTSEEAYRLATEAGLESFDHLKVCQIHHAARLVAILEVYAMFDPEIGYCQGMSDLLSPFIALIESNSEAFWCFVEFMKVARENFRTDETGISKQLSQISRIVQASDQVLYSHLVNINAENFYFVYRMVVVLFRRELTFEQTICLWEVVWSDMAEIRFGSLQAEAYKASKSKAAASKDLLLFVVAATILKKRKLILETCQGVDDLLRECNAASGQWDIWELLHIGRRLIANFHEKVD